MLVELEHFLLVLREGTFTAAARAAHLTQPALSASIARLEDQLGARLFERGRQGARPTAAGSALVPHARAAIAAVEDGRRAVADVEGLNVGEVAFGAGATVATYHAPERLARFRRERPGLTITMREMPTSALLERVADGSLDLAVIDRKVPGFSFSVPRNVDLEDWGDDAFLLVGGPDVATCEGQPFVTFVRGGATRAALDHLFPDAKVVVELSGVAAVKQHVRQSVGIALLARSAVADDFETGRMRSLAHPLVPVRRTYAIAHRGRARLSPAASALRDSLMADPPRYAEH